MYKENELFDTPSDNSKIWRYLDFTKFLDLLDKSALFFSRLDKLGDPFEGVCPIYSIDTVVKETNTKWNEKTTKKFQKHYSLYIKIITAVNCWHLNSFESSAMWKIYIKSGEGIAIQSTVKHLKDSLKDKNNDIFIGSVRYINYEKFTSSVNPLKIMSFPIIYKRKVFQHERELRAIIQKIPEGNTGIVTKFKINDGLFVPVDLDTLIDDIFLAPTSPDWQRKLLDSIINKYKLNKKVIHSSLDDQP
jgi:hypothetical protein